MARTASSLLHSHPVCQASPKNCLMQGSASPQDTVCVTGYPRGQASSFSYGDPGYQQATVHEVLCVFVCRNALARPHSTMAVHVVGYHATHDLHLNVSEMWE